MSEGFREAGCGRKTSTGQDVQHPHPAPRSMTPAPKNSPRALRQQHDCSFGPTEESQTLPGLPADGAESSTPLASATVALIKRTICLPLNQTQIPFPSNVPWASRDSGGPSRLHLLPQSPGWASPSPFHVWRVGEQEVGEVAGSDTAQRGKPGDLIASKALSARPPRGSCPPRTLGSTCRRR